MEKPIEVIKQNMSQLKDGGWKVTFFIHPNDVPQHLLSSSPGQAYAMALVPINYDNPEPIFQDGYTKDSKPRKKWHEMGITQRAALLCRNNDFQESMGALNPEEAAQKLREYCGVKSRTEIEGNPEALSKYLNLESEFIWRESYVPDSVYEKELGR